MGGIFGAVAVIAILAELILNGISAESVVSAVKDIAGTIVSVMVFVIAAKHILRQIKESKSFEDNLKNALDAWQQEHSNMIVRKESYDREKENAPASCFSFGLKTNISDFYNKSTTSNTGWFVRMPLLKKENYNGGNIELRFHLNKGTFFEGVEMTKEELAQGYTALNNLFTGFINTCFQGYAQAAGRGQDITVTISEPIETKEDIEKLVSVIDSMYNAYLVAANLNVKY